MAAIRDATEAGDGPALARAQAAMDAALHSQLAPTWDLMWRAHALLATLPEAAHAQRRWKDDRRSFTAQAAWLREGGAPQPRRDSAVAAAKRLARLEREQQRLAVERAHDDPLVMAEYRLTGEAFAGTVVARRPDPARHRRQEAQAPAVADRPDHRRGHRRAGHGARLPGLPRPDGQGHRGRRQPANDNHDDNDNDDDNDHDQRRRHPGHARAQRRHGPRPGRPARQHPGRRRRVTYTTLRDDFQPAPQFPSREETPWTHGGPPPEYVPTDDDAQEPWS